MTRRPIGAAALLLLLGTAARAQQSGVDAVTQTQVTSSTQTGGVDLGAAVNDPTSLTSRGGAAIRSKTYQETIGTPIGTSIGSPIGTAMGVPH